MSAGCLLPVDRLEQWRCTADAVCGFVAAALGLRQSDKRRTASADFLEIGMATGDKRSQMLCLQTGGELMLVAGGTRCRWLIWLRIAPVTYSLDSARVGQLVDAATTADNRYTPSNAKREARKVDTQAMYKDWQKAYRALSRSARTCPRLVRKADRQDGYCQGSQRRHHQEKHALRENSWAESFRPVLVCAKPCVPGFCCIRGDQLAPLRVLWRRPKSLDITSSTRVPCVSPWHFFAQIAHLRFASASPQLKEVPK